MTNIGIKTFCVDILEGLHGVGEVAIIKTGQSNKKVIVVHPTAVGVALNGDRRHLYDLLGILFVRFGQNGIELRVKSQDLIWIIVQAFQNDLFNFPRFFPCVEIPVEMGCCIVENVTRNGILVGRAAPANNR